ncbi:TonB family protein [Geobacter hydrogenophilus]|uniref:TonB-dependent receptor n=1 Tax=Geobacter hydrogenophilus TaxID=40983 RepID=A0A9W6FXZ5_9BACT|nr:TonB family protein [Geobacter hydrogenophilus]MBT0895683.1 TonB family protein [Geobacter hydrogenophilus]GLI36848.1 TonB-dependent receptor [Geobacter hydrogenophilus]
MPDKYVEKSFLYLVALSLLLHAGLFALIILYPQAKPVLRQEPIMIDLEDIPDLRQAPTPTDSRREVRRQAEQPRRVPREMAPRGDRERDHTASLPPVARPIPSRPAAPYQAAPQPRRGEGVGPSATNGRTGEIPVREAPRGGGILKPRASADAPELAQLMPSAQRLAKIEESYRKKYRDDVADGDTKFLDTDDLQFGSFLRRFENAIYGVWRYPQEAARLGIEGVTPVKITFNRSGAIVKYEILQSSGSRILDDEVLRTLRMVGPVGPFPKGYDRDEFHLIAFFQYGIVRGASRSLR